MARIADHLHRIFLAVALIAFGLQTAHAAGMAAGVAEPAPRSAWESVFPEQPARAGVSPRVAALSSAIIVRWEIGSPGQYNRKYSGVYWPGGASGPTWGIGYDGGHQSPATIERDWAGHPSLNALSLTSGITGARAQREIARWRGITTPFSYAMQVFSDRSLPAYHLQSRSALGRDFEQLPDPAQSALNSMGYNRGWSMLGPRNAEKRVIRDQCLPARDTACIARQLNAMCRLWAGTPNGTGLCNRRADEARLAVQS
jgi:hypothetical protein